MEAKHIYTIEEVKGLIDTNFPGTYATTEEGQAQLIRVAKAATNESIEKRKVTSIKTRAATAFDRELGKVAAKTPDKVNAFMDGKAAWIAKHIARKYDIDEE